MCCACGGESKVLGVVMKPGEIPITKSCEASGPEVQLVFTQPSVAHGCPGT